MSVNATQPENAAAELALPTLDVRALARRAALPAAFAVVAVAAVVVLGGPLRTFADAFNRALGADPRWVVGAAAFEVLSFVGYIALLWLVGSRASSRLGLRESAEITLGGAAATRLLPTGGVGGAALTLWAFRRTGLGAREATRTLLAFLVLVYAVFLGAIVVAGGVLALGLAQGDGPLALSAVPAIGAALAIIAALGLAVAARRPAAIDSLAEAPAGASHLARARVGLRNTPGVLGASVRDAIGVLRSGDVRLLGAPAWWAFDAAVLWSMLNALGTPPSLAIVMLAYFVGQVANTIPIPGAVSGGMVGVLLAFGVQTDLALASVLAYRSVAIWLPAPIGLAALSGLRRTVARWGEAEPGEPAPAEAPAGVSHRRSRPAAAPARHHQPRPVPAWASSEARMPVAA